MHLKIQKKCGTKFERQHVVHMEFIWGLYIKKITVTNKLELPPDSKDKLLNIDQIIMCSYFILFF